MKKKFIYSFVIICAILLQTSILPVVFPLKGMGDAVLMMILAWSILDGFFGFLSWAIFAGVLYDLASFYPIGVHVLIFLTVVYLVSFSSRRISVDLKGAGLFLLLLFVLTTTIVSHAAIALYGAFDQQTLHGYWGSFGSVSLIAIQTICNIALFFFWFVILKKIKTFFMLEI